MYTLLADQRKVLLQTGYSEKAINLIQNKTNMRMMENPTCCMSSESCCGDTLVLYALIREGRLRSSIPAASDYFLLRQH